MKFMKLIHTYFKTFKNQGKCELMLAEKKMVINFIEKWIFGA